MNAQERARQFATLHAGSCGDLEAETVPMGDGGLSLTIQCSCGARLDETLSQEDLLEILLGGIERTSDPGA